MAILMYMEHASGFRSTTHSSFLSPSIISISPPSSLGWILSWGTEKERLCRRLSSWLVKTSSILKHTTLNSLEGSQGYHGTRQNVRVLLIWSSQLFSLQLQDEAKIQLHKESSDFVELYAHWVFPPNEPIESKSMPCRERERQLTIIVDDADWGLGSVDGEMWWVLDVVRGEHQGGALHLLCNVVVNDVNRYGDPAATLHGDVHFAGDKEVFGTQFEIVWKEWKKRFLAIESQLSELSPCVLGCDENCSLILRNTDGSMLLSSSRKSCSPESPPSFRYSSLMLKAMREPLEPAAHSEVGMGKDRGVREIMCHKTVSDSIQSLHYRNHGNLNQRLWTSLL